MFYPIITLYLCCDSFGCLSFADVHDCCYFSSRDNYVQKLQRQEEMRKVREEIERQQEEEYKRKQDEQGVYYLPFLMNSMKLVVPLHSLYWSIHTKDESKRGTAFAFIFGVN